MLQSKNWHLRNRRDTAPDYSAGGFTLTVGMVFLLFFAILNPSGHAFSQEQKHSDPSRSCVSSECHADIVNHKYLHGPLKIGQCTVCHAPLPGTDHKFELLETDAKLCLMCHEPVDTKGYLLHDPVAKGECLGCHDPHGSEEPSQVIKSPQIKLCDECHKPVLTRKYAHKPVAEGECMSCHPPHESRFKNLLVASGNKLCLQECHEKMRPVVEAKKEQKVHLASEDCSKCHRAHDSNLPSLLTRPPLELCLDGCHEEIKKDMESSKFKHDAMTEELGCVECHRAHDNKLGQLLRKPETELCFTCHEKLQAQIAAAKFKHRPASDKWCVACHLPHGSQYRKLLFVDYPSTTLSAYDPAKYALCFTCHREGIVRERYVDDQTNFRNGRLNLHYLHVHREKDGLTCRACHTEHASNQPAHVREKVPSGDWEIPIKFTRSKTGGTCVTGCHKEYTYDRVNPVQLNAK